MSYYLKMEPHLFKEAVNTQFERIREEREATAEAAREREKNAPPASTDKSELVLYRCPHCLLHRSTCRIPDDCPRMSALTLSSVRGLVLPSILTGKSRDLYHV